MASVSNDPGGLRRILFVAPDGSRKTIRLGKTSQRAAESVAVRVEHLLQAKLTGAAVDADTARWLAELDARLAKRLAAVGLIAAPEAKAPATLGAFVDSYIAGRTDLKPATVVSLGHARRGLVKYFGSDKPLADVSPGDADGFRLWMADSEGLAENTIRHRCGIARQFFRSAMRKRLIGENPFGDMRGVGVRANRTRDYFLTRADADKVLDACFNSQWRLLFVLSRYGGLRCPSEHLALRWGDIDWAAGRMRVRSPKTEHHAGGESRIVPIFPELRPHLEASFDAAEPGTEFVITQYRGSKQNLRTEFQRIIGKAGLAPWPKPFHNLRASRATELANEYPAHVAAAWLGHSTIVANKHYWQVTDADFERATTSGEKAAQNPAQYMHAIERIDSQADLPENEKTPVLPGFALSCETVQNRGGVDSVRDERALQKEGAEHPAPAVSGQGESAGQIGRPTGLCRRP